MGRVRNWVQSSLTALPLVFSSADLHLYEDSDYPGDPAPYLVLYWRRAHVASVCKCKRQRPADQFVTNMEREEALALAAAIQRHYATADAKLRERRLLARRIKAREASI